MPLLGEWTKERRTLIERSNAEAWDAEEIAGREASEADAISGWWILPVVVAGLLAWIWIVGQAMRLIDWLFS